MKGLKLWRTFQEGVKNYTRNGWLTVATVVVMTMSLFIVSMTMILGITMNLVLNNLRDKINIGVSFNADVSEESILAVKKELEQYKEVSSVEYVSRDQSLAKLQAMSGNDTVITQALEEIGENPLLASLNIKARNLEQYDEINAALKKAPFYEDINRINYEKNKKAIERLNAINATTRDTGLALGLIFAAVSFLITLNTVRINMHSRRNEFEIMRLVGASNTYVRLPSIFEGIFYGLTASFTTLVFVFIALRSVAPLTKGLVSSGTLLEYYAGNFLFISIFITALGIALGVFGGWAATRKYLKF